MRGKKNRQKEEKGFKKTLSNLFTPKESKGASLGGPDGGPNYRKGRRAE